MGCVVGHLFSTGRSKVAKFPEFPELPESAIRVMGGQAGITDKLALIALSATTCSPWGYTLEGGVLGEVVLVGARMVQEGLVTSLNILALPPRRLSNAAWV